MVNRGIELRKELRFNAEDLQDNPNMCMDEILQYLTDHADKIEDYWIENYVNEDTFKPTLILHMKLNKETLERFFGIDKDGKILDVSGKRWLEFIEKVKTEPIFKNNPNL